MTLRYDSEPERDVYVVGDGYRFWVKDGSGRYVVIISRELLANLVYPEQPETAFETYSGAILHYAEKLISDGSTEKHEDHRFMVMRPHNADAIRSCA